MLVITLVDRFGRSLADLIKIADELRQHEVSLYIAQQSIDTAAPMGQMFYAMLGVFAEFEYHLRRERQVEGIARAKAAGRYKGRKPLATARIAAIRRMRADGHRPADIARQLKVGRTSVYKVPGCYPPRGRATRRLTWRISQRPGHGGPTPMARAHLVNYRLRQRAGPPIGTSTTERLANTLVNRCLNKALQMRSGPSGALTPSSPSTPRTSVARRRGWRRYCSLPEPPRSRRPPHSWHAGYDKASKLAQERACIRMHSG